LIECGKASIDTECIYQDNQSHKMKKILVLLISVTSLTALFQACTSAKALPKNSSNHVWTFTYLKAVENQKENLKVYIEKNWFVMDSIALKQGLIGQYELYENKNSENNDWDFIVAVEYLTPKAFEDIAKAFEAIRAKHQVIQVNGMGMKELGRVLKSETLSKKIYAK